MKIGKRGKDLAVRIPKEVVIALGLELGDELDIVAVGPGYFKVAPVRKGTQEQ